MEYTYIYRIYNKIKIMASKNDDLVLTSTKVHKDVFEEFKIASIRNKFSMQKLINRSMNLYIHDEGYRKLLHNHLELVLSGSI